MTTTIIATDAKQLLSTAKFAVSFGETAHSTVWMTDTKHLITVVEAPHAIGPEVLRVHDHALLRVNPMLLVEGAEAWNPVPLYLRAPVQWRAEADSAFEVASTRADRGLRAITLLIFLGAPPDARRPR
jgi:hypothetical protein